MTKRFCDKCGIEISMEAAAGECQISQSKYCKNQPQFDELCSDCVRLLIEAVKLPSAQIGLVLRAGSDHSNKEEATNVCYQKICYFLVERFGLHPTQKDLEHIVSLSTGIVEKLGNPAREIGRGGMVSPHP